MITNYIFIYILSTSPLLINAQLGPDSSTLSDSCECVPSCTNKNIEPLYCKGGRIAPRKDCPCCQVCLRHDGESCQEPEMPCDKAAGLTCSANGFCQDIDDNIQSLKFPKWDPRCKSDEDCPDNLFCLGDKCSDPCEILHPCDGYLKGGECHTRLHQTKCECPKGTTANHESRACLPHLGETSASSTLVSPSQKKIVCTVEGKTHDIGDTYYSMDCHQRCICAPEGTPICGSFSCPAGLFPSGSSSHEKYCIELRNSPEADDCCVVLACASDFLDTLHSNSSDDILNALTGRKIQSELDQRILEEEYPQKLIDLKDAINGDLRETHGHNKDLKHELPDDNFLEELRITTMPSSEPPLPTVKGNITLAERIQLHKNIVGGILDSNAGVTERATLTTFLLHNKNPKNKSLETTTEALNAKHETTAVSPVQQLEYNRVTKMPSMELMNTIEFPAPSLESDSISEPTNAHVNMEGDLTIEHITMSDINFETDDHSFDETSALKINETEFIDQDLKNETRTIVELEDQAVTYQIDSILATTPHFGVSTQDTTIENDAEDFEATTVAEHGSKIANNFTVSELISRDSDISDNNNDVSEPFILGDVNNSTKVMMSEHDLLLDVLNDTSTTVMIDKFSKSIMTTEETMTINSTEFPLLAATTTTMPDDMNDGVIKEITEDGEFLHNMSFFSDISNHNSFLEGKEQGMKPTGIPEKESKSQNKFSSKLDVIQIKVSTQNSSTLILPSSSGGIIHYKESRSDIEAAKKVVSESDGNIVTITGLTPSTRYTIKWAGNDGSSSKSEIKTEDGCLQSGMSYAVGSKWHEECQTTCSCHLGGVSECRPRCIFIAGAIQDDQCVEQPSRSDPECCVEYNCEKGDNSVLDTAPISSDSSGATQLTDSKLIVTSRAHNSVTVAWDDFRAGNPDSGYVTEYREVPSTPIDTKIPWMKKETSSDQPPPTMTIAMLKPNTLYEVRVGIYSNEKDRNLNAATETIKVRTEPGCVYGNSSFGVGEFFQGCEERCSCSKDGSVKCSKRCTIPYFKKGTFAEDPYCTEDVEDSDECCVLVMCAHGENRGDDQVLLDFDQCANTVCGANAECVSWPSINDSTDGQKLPQPGSCRCKDGFSGNPNDLITGCVADPDVKTEENSCNFKHKLYSPGDVFFDGCSYRCTCNSMIEIECQPRCKFSSDETAVDSSTCTFHPDPDDSCCLIRLCNSTTVEDIKDVQPALAFDGCTFGNKTYSKNESFTMGCDSKCLCMGFGDVSCFPRCPPIKEKSTAKGVICETLLDPEDECCNVTVCDDSVPDVMKANVTDNETLGLMAEEGEKLVETTTTHVDTEDEGNMTKIEMTEHMDNETMDIESRTLQRPLNDSKISEDETSTLKEVDEPPFVKATIYQTGEENVTESFRAIHFPDHTTNHPIDMFDDETFNISHGGNDTDMLMKKPRFEDIMIPKIEIEEIIPIDSSSVKMSVKVSQAILHKLLSSPKEFVTVTYSHDSLRWKNRTIPIDDLDVENMYNIVFTVPNLEDYDAYQFRVIYDDFVSPVSKASLKSSAVFSDSQTIRHESCEFKGRLYKVGETFHDECIQFCTCNDDLKSHCQYIECPEHFGLDILDPGCLEWEDDPEYVPVPPRCCGNKPKCALHINDLSCNHEGRIIKHLDFVPREFSECDQRCQCMRGTMECESLCSPVTAAPPFNLDCHASEAKITTMSTFPCCKAWQCINDSDSENFHPMPEGPHSHGIPINKMPGPPAPPPAISLPIVHMSDDGVHLYFNIPSTFVGLPGGIYLRYTPDIDYNPNPLDWESEVIHEDGVTLDQAKWQYVKRNLLPGTNYTMQLVLSSHVSKAEIVSPDFVVQTHPAEPDELMIDAELSVSKIANSSVKISWRPFPDRELQYINSLHLVHWSRSDKIPEYGPPIRPTYDSAYIEDLQPGTKYAAALVIMVQEGSPVHMYSQHNVTFETLHAETETAKKPAPLPRLDLDAELAVSDIQNTSVKISWKNFDEMELQYIDGIRVRFWPENKRFPEEGPMLHREADNMILRDLEPGTKYLVDLFFIPHEGLTTTISNTKNITFTTLPKLKDKYAFNITISAGEISEDGVQILYSGVAEPEGKYINVYRVVYTSDGDSQDSQKFKVPKNQKDGFIMLTDLKQGIQYEVWLEAYLTNGGKKKSNVITVETNYGQSLLPEKSEIIKSKELRQDGDVSYYSAFVAVAILVAIACLIIIGLLFVLMRRQNHAKAHINSSKGVAAYDNPSYKTSETNYAIEMNGLKNTTNGNSLQPEEP